MTLGTSVVEATTTTTTTPSKGAVAVPDPDKTPRTRGRRSMTTKIKNKLPVVSISIPKHLQIEIDEGRKNSPSSRSNTTSPTANLDQDKHPDISKKGSDTLSPGNHSAGTITAATTFTQESHNHNETSTQTPAVLVAEEEEALLRKVEDTLQKHQNHIISSGSSVFSETDVQRDSFIARLAQLTRKARNSSSASNASIGASTLERHYMSETDDDTTVASRLNFQPHDATHKDLIDALERMNELLKVTELDLSGEKKKRKTREKNMIKLAKELGTRGKIMEQQINKINELKHDLRVSHTEIELMTKQLTHAEASKERIATEARQERERLLEEAKQRYEQTCQEHDQRLKDLAKTHEAHCERLCREILEAGEENKQLKHALQRVKEELNSKPPPPETPPPVPEVVVGPPSSFEVRKYMLMGALMTCCGLLLGKVALETFIRPQRPMPATPMSQASSYPDKNDDNMAPRKKNVLWEREPSKRRSLLPSSRTRIMMQPKTIYEPPVVVAEQEEATVSTSTESVQDSDEVRPVAFEDIATDQVQQHVAEEPAVSAQEPEPEQVQVIEKVVEEEEKVVIDIEGPAVSVETQPQTPIRIQSIKEDNHHLVQPEKIRAYVQNWLNILRQGMVFVHSNKRVVKSFVARVGDKVRSIEWSTGMSSSEWVAIHDKLL